MPGPVRRLRRLVREGSSDAPGRLVDTLGRIGLVGYGVVHLLVAALALQAAFGVPDAPADAEGAIATIAAGTGGAVVLVVVTGGLLAFALWQVSSAALGFRRFRGAELFRKRTGALAKAIAVSALAVIAAGFVDGRRERSADARTLTQALLDLPAGRLLVGAVAAAAFGIAAAMTYTGLRRTFLDDLELDALGDTARRIIAALGVIGHLGRAVALVLVGAGIGTAAVLGNAAAARGLDGALRGVAATTPGAVLLPVVAAGFAAYGLYCFVDAVLRRI